VRRFPFFLLAAFALTQCLPKVAPVGGPDAGDGGTSATPDAGDAGVDSGPSDAGTSDAACLPPTLTIIQTGQKVLQVTGETDRALGIPTLSQTFSNYRLAGTDLGTSFLHAGKLWFLFGDTSPTGGTNPNPLCGDSIASTSQIVPADATSLTIDFVSNDAGFQSPSVAGVNLACFNVPLSGVSKDSSSMYVWFSTNCMSKSLLAHSEDGAHTFTPVSGYVLSDCGCSSPTCGPLGPSGNVCTNLSGCHFVNVSTQVVSAERAGLSPDAGPAVLLFGSGEYRKSDVYLARTPLSAIEDSSQLEYFAGAAGGCGSTWSPDQSSAVPLFSTAADGPAIGSCVGELSVRYVPALSAFLALYNCGAMIIARAALQPWGPWTASQVDFDVKDGYCKFIYKPDSGCPQLSDPGRADVIGGAYGPYQIDPYAQGTTTPPVVLIYYLMSPWNPYNAMLMNTQLSVTSP
jgi:hypothetical protein